MNNHFGYCERCYKKIINIEDIYVRQTEDGDTLYCLKCKEEILHIEAEFERLFIILIWQRLQKILIKNVKQNLN